MNNEQILKKAIEKAVKNGYELPKWMYNPKTMEHIGSAILRCNYLERLIFSHDFAEAIWGEWEEVVFNCKKCKPNQCSCERLTSGWQQHLRQMVLEPNPLKYIEKYL